MELLVIPTVLIVIGIVAVIATLTYVLDRCASHHEQGGGS
jgi:hypothetical protein